MMNRREMVRIGLLSGGAMFLPAASRRASAANQVAGHPTGGVFNPPSPPVTPFAVELHRIPTKTPLPGAVNDLSLPANGGVAPNGTVYPQVTGNDALATFMNSLERFVVAHQRNSGNNIQFPPRRHYVLKARQARHAFHPDAPYSNNGGSIIWGYDGQFPGPTFQSRYGEPVLVRIFNDLFDDPEANPTTPGQGIPGGFGMPRISTHLHNGHTASESDGNPVDVYPPAALPDHLPQLPDSILNLKFRDHHYPMFRAGLDPRVAVDRPAPNKNDGDPAETLCTLWYHDHSMDHTAENVYKGLVGFHLFFDEIDSGNENDPAPGALRLPSGDFDIPLLFQDKRFDSDGQLILRSASANPGSDPDGRLGILGDRFTVNGQIQPKLTVLRRKYRFRLLNAGPSRFYQFFLTKSDQDQPFVQIGNDESLLEIPYAIPPHDGVLLSVAERVDVVIDFTNCMPGETLFLVNRLVMQNEGFGPVVAEVDANGKFVRYQVLPEGQGDPILRFDVTDGAVTDSPPLPARLRPNPAMPTFTSLPPEDLKKLPNHRQFVFALDDATGTTWVVNERPFDPSPAGASAAVDGTLLPVGHLDTPRSGLPGEPQMHDGEVWTIINRLGSNWAHPIHIHLEEFRILWRDGKAPPPPERTRKDVLLLHPEEEVQIYLRFRDFYGKYPIHCHNVLHEDHEMMIRFDVVGDY